MKKTLTVTIILAVLVIASACNDPGSSNVSVTGVTLDQFSLNLFPGNTVTLAANVLPQDATNRAISWSTNNPGVATVNNNGW